jgi:hypothetical protein
MLLLGVEIKLVRLYRSLALCDIFLHVMLVVIILGAIGTCFEVDMKAEIGRVDRMQGFERIQFSTHTHTHPQHFQAKASDHTSSVCQFWKGEYRSI